MNFSEKLYYKNIKNNNDTIFNKLSKFKNINPVLIYVHEIRDNAKQKKDKIPTVKEFAKMWENLNSSS